MNEKKKVINTKTYKIIVIEYDNDTNDISRTSDGFNAYELLGLLEDTQLDIINQIRRLIPPATMVEKKVIVRKNAK